MKQVVIILTLIAVISMVVCGCIFDKPHESYAKSTIVIDVDYDDDLVTVQDFFSNVWQFFGCEDWAEGDICALTMDNNGTSDTIYDDFITNTNYCGWVY